MEKIYEILNELHPEYDFRASDDYIREGYLDSLDVVSLVSELENAFDILIDALDILPENFANAQMIGNVVTKNGGTL